MTEERRIQLVTEVDNTGARAGFDELSQQAGQMASSVSASGQRAERAVNDIGAGANASASKVESAQRNLIGSIQRTTAQMEAGSRSSAKYYETLAAQRGVDPAVLEPYLAQLRAVELAQQRARTAATGGAAGIDDLGISAGQTANAMRQLPAQITDVVTSLQGGMDPLTVLIQQGGQVADAFGGIQPALQHVGQHLMRLITPFSVALVSVGALAFAYKTGAKEADAYARAIAESGNAIGATTDQMAEAARQASAISGSQSDAAEAIVALAGASQVSAENMARFAAVATEGQRVLGRSIADTVSEFDSLGSSPLSALSSLNDKYHFLTAEVYAHVKALEDQGRAAEAANAAQLAYAEGMEKQRYKVLDTLSDWERGWLRIKKWTSEAMDSIPGIGRAATDFEKLNGLLEDRERIEKNIATATAGGDKFGAHRQTVALARVDAEISAIRARGDAQRAAAKAQADAAQTTEAHNKWLADSDRYLTKAARLERDLARARNEGNAAFANLLPKEREKLIAERQDAIRKAALQGDWDAAAKKREEQMRAEAAAMAELAGLTTSFASDWQMLSTMYGKGAISLEQLTKAQADLLANQPAMKAAAEQEIADRKLMLAAAEEYAKVFDAAAGAKNKAQVDLAAQQAENDQIGLGTLALAELNAVRLESMALRAEEKIWAAEGIDITGQLAEQYRQEAAALRERATAVREGAAKQLTFDTNKKALDELNQFLDPSRAQDFGQALRESFGTAGDSLSRLTASLDGFGKRQAEIAKQRAAAESLRGTDGFDEVKYQKAIADLNERETKNRLAGYGAMTNAAAGFFGEQSRGYKALQTASQVFHAAELAMTLAELVPKGISAVLTQGTGDPYTAFGRMAAMAAIVTGLGVAIGGIGGKADTTAVDRQKANGTGSILGDSDAKSESIKNALGAIEDNTYQGLTINSSMLTVLRSIDSGINGVSNMLYRTSGFTTQVAGMQEGAVSRSFQSGILGEINKALSGGEWFGKALGKVGNAIFGGNVTTVDTGITFDAASLAQILASGINVGQYTDTKKDGGLFRKDKYGTTVKDLGDEIDSQFTLIFGSMYDAIVQGAGILGVGGGTFIDTLSSFKVDLGKISTKDMKPEDVQAALQNAISKAGDDMAKFAVAGLGQFQKAGEGALETLTRIAAEYQTVDVVMESFGKTFGIVGMESVGARERLIDLAGGLEEFASSAEQFLNDFYSDQERADSLRARITPTLDQYGIKTGAEDSLQQFRNVVTGLDLTTEAGARAYATLIQIAPAFKQIADVDAKIFEERAELQDELDQLTMSAAQLLAKQRDALDESNRALFDQIQAIKAQAAAVQTAKDVAAGLITSVDGAFSVLQKVISRQKTALQDEITLRNKSIQSIESLSQSLRSTLDGMSVSGREVEDRQAAQAQIQAALAIAKASGVLPKADDLKSALSVLGRDASSQFATQQDYLRDFYATRLGIEDLAGLTDDALSVEERSLKQLESQVTQYDQMIERAQEQVDVLKGISTTGLSIEQALLALQVSIGQAQANPVNSATSAINDAYKSALGRAPDAAGLGYYTDRAAAGASIGDIVGAIKNSPEAQLQSLYKDVFGRAPDAAGLNYWMSQMKAGASLADVRAAFENSGEKLRGFAVGTNYVPVDMPAQIHQGERIIPAADNRELMRRLASPEQNNAALEAAVARLTREVEGLRAETRAVATHTEKSGRLLGRVIRNDVMVTAQEA